MFFQAGASGFQDVSQDYWLGEGPGCSQVQEGQSDHRPLWLAPDVCCVEGESFDTASGYQPQAIS